MTSLIFVHGTGGREAAYAATFQQIERVLAARRKGVSLYPCLWGDALGASLNAGGTSIPDYEASAGGQPIAAEPDGILLWEALYKDPLHEIRLLGLRPLQGQRTVPGRQTAAQEVQSRVANLPGDAALVSKLDELEIGAVFVSACEWVAGKESKSFGLLLTTVARPLEGDYAAIARAIVAAARLLCKDQLLYPPLLWNEQLRDEAVDAIAQSLTQNETSRGVITDWVTQWLKSAGTNAIKRRRGAIMDDTYPFAGDILLYQARGQKIRDFIRAQVENEQVKPPVVLMAHSLGGIACVDLLIEQDLREKVACLITVGSQAPFFYEIGALQQLAYGEPLPKHFPKKWLNVYDLRDFLSYVGDRPGLFPGKMTDVLVDNKQPFPEAHGAYWANVQTWDAIEKVLP
ncbi:MAG: hypothetical protein DCF15_19860 [Phormidesmis priestleyi]|uniref:Alpha/beta hydrolase n=1 Tax=Phormidesmis priestleyi TaxID=268141 RepID=A0A2W4WPD7_9CYAN|nr:MAG: hypothetical protein DCF15_19860 [Phormidesmis priestleyi]